MLLFYGKHYNIFFKISKNDKKFSGFQESMVLRAYSSFSVTATPPGWNPRSILNFS